MRFPTLTFFALMITLIACDQNAISPTEISPVLEELGSPESIIRGETDSESTDEATPAERTRTREYAESCFEVVYPINFTMPDGSTVTVTQNRDTSLRAWYRAHPRYTERPTVAFPLTIVFDGSRVRLNDRTGLHRVYAACESDTDDEEQCFAFVYPISYLMPDSSTVTVASKESPALRRWYAANPRYTEEATLLFPVDVVFENGNTATLNSERALRRAWASCGD